MQDNINRNAPPKTIYQAGTACPFSFPLCGQRRRRREAFGPLPGGSYPVAAPVLTQGGAYGAGHPYPR